MAKKLITYNIFEIFGSDLSGQERAVLFKNEILNADCDEILFDFSNVRSVTSGWSRVLFGQILLEKGFEFWSKKIRIINHENVRTSILEGINEVYDINKKRLESLEKLSKLDQELGLY